MQVMLQMGLDDEVLAALQMLRESSMTTILVEQAHAREHKLCDDVRNWAWMQCVLAVQCTMHELFST